MEKQIESKIKYKKNKEPLEMFNSKKEPRKAFQTFLRNQNKLNVNSINAIDRKAAIMIRVNSMIISAIVIFFTRIEEVPNGFLIGTVLVISCFLSLIFALNASRPQFFLSFFFFKRVVKKRNLLPEERIFIAGAAADLSPEEYEKAFNNIVNNQTLQIGNQVRAMHVLERHIKKAFINIEVSFLAFMVGFIATVILFVLGIWF